MSGKLLLKLEAVSFMLTNHTSQYYTFLDAPPNSRNRTAYYATLARLLFMDDTPTRFKAFVAPLHQVQDSAMKHAFAGHGRNAWEQLHTTTTPPSLTCATCAHTLCRCRCCWELRKLHPARPAPRRCTPWCPRPP